MVRDSVLSALVLCLLVSCSCAERDQPKTIHGPGKAKVRLVTLDPGHYHAALVQRSMYEQVDPVVGVYAPPGSEVRNHLKYIHSFNNRAEDPTRWVEKVYTGDDYLQRMLAERSGDVVVISGNNQKKTEYIRSAVNAGLNVLSDKPMCIDANGFRLLKEAFASADKKGLVLYDIMTERFNIFRIMQKTLVLNEDVFGRLKRGSEQEPAIVQESVHHLFKHVSGMPLKRPVWYFDTSQQGEGLVDVTTHLIDLAMWTCFGDQALDYRTDVAMKKARHWPTMITRQQYEKVTGAADFPDFLKDKLNSEGILPYYANGEMVYSLKGVHVKLSVTWDFQAPEGGGDTQYSSFAGTKATVFLKQGPEQDYKPQLSVAPAGGINLEQLGGPLKEAIADAQSEYPGLALKRQSDCWEVVIPKEYQAGHEAHFREVTERYLRYLAAGELPAWETPNMITKYYITTAALELAQQ